MMARGGPSSATTRQKEIGRCGSARHANGKRHNALLQRRPLYREDGPKRARPSAAWVRQLAADEPETPFASVFVSAGIPSSPALIRRSVYDQTPGWDEQFGPPYEDNELLLQIAIRSMIHYAPEPLVMYRRHASQYSVYLILVHPTHTSERSTRGGRRCAA